MSITPDVVIGLLSFLLLAGGNVAYTASRFGYFSAKLEAMQARMEENYKNQAREISRLTEMIDNDVSGRRAFVAATERLARLEEKVSALVRETA
ncbi:hypothetical protein ACIU1J_32350 [Azospirillum doebereinerae]|uniref:hypothetical protein n=1 Tax=Azospirillum doebereinerae TaxID=92933 RepID=UPI001EE58CF7|nr:hypothetical protein [Azospirillum doebereinerae]MCG5243973.1 hypothetical protein [Azospirillum doebereinerae]